MVDLGPNQPLIGRPDGRAALQTPALVVDLPAMQRNIAAMAAYAKSRDVGLRPHSKTHKSARIARLQVDAGATGVCVVTVGEAAPMVAAGIPGVLITSPVVVPAKVDRLIALNEQAEGLMVVADNAENVDALASAAGASGRPLTVVVDLDVGTHRTGAADLETAVALARQVSASNALQFGGVQAYAGHLQHVEDYGTRRDLASEQAVRVASLTEQLTAAGLAPPIVTGAGTGTHEIDATGGAFTELQVGSYIFTDVQYDAVALTADEQHPFAPALTVQVSVVSNNASGFVTTDGGLKRFATDGPKPEILRGAPSGSSYRFMGDEHGAVIFPDSGATLPLGAKVECLTPHCDPTVNLYDYYHVVDGDELVDIWPVDGRGAI